MAKERVYTSSKKEEDNNKNRNVGYKSENISDLNFIMTETQKGKYEALYPIYSKGTGRLLLNTGKVISKETFDRLRREINESYKKNRPSPYFFQIEKKII